MTVTTTNTVNNYTGNGSQTVFAFTYQILTDQNGNPQISTVAVYLAAVLQNAGFTTLANANQTTNPGGTVTFAVAPANGVAVQLLRNTPVTQSLTFPLEAKISTPALENAIDKNVLLVQENEYQLGLKPSLPAATAGGVLAWNAGASALQDVNPITAGYALIDNGTGKVPSFQPVTNASGGNMAGPTPATNVAHSVPLWNGVDGRTVKSGAAPVQAGYVFGDNGPTLDPSFQSLPSLLPTTVVQFGGPSSGVSLRPLLVRPTGLTVTPTGAAGATTYNYQIVAKDATGTDVTAGGVAVNTTTGNATLTAGNYNALAWTAVPGAASYDVYLVTTVGVYTFGKLANVLTNSYNHVGASGDSTTAPTSSTFTGEHWHNGNFSSDAPIIATRLRLHISGNFTQNATHTITISTELPGGLGNSAQYSGGANGAGIGFGAGGAVAYNNGTANPGILAGGGGGNGGAGGSGGAYNATAPLTGGIAYAIENQLAGSSGGAGCSWVGGAVGGSGGAGGGALLIEANGSVSLNANVTGAGGAGGAAYQTTASNAGGGGGSGATLAVLCTGTYTRGAVTLTLTGGAGGQAGTSAAGGGGGGGGGRDFGRAAVVADSATVVLTGGAGAAGVGGSGGGGNGGAGVQDVKAVVYSVRSAA